MGIVILFWSSAINVRAANEMNTLSYFIGQQESAQTVNGGVRVETVVTALDGFTFFIGDEASLAKGVFFEISGVSADASGAGGNNTIDVSIDDSPFAQARAKSFTLNSNGRETPFRFLYDATSYVGQHIYDTGRGTYGPYTLNIKSSTASALWSVRMIITYKHNTPASSATYEMNTLSYFIGQQESSQTVPGGTRVETVVTALDGFTFFIGDEASLAKGVFFEISGVSASANPNTIDVSIDDSTFSSGRQKSYALNANGRETPFRFLYDATSYIGQHIIDTGRGTYGPYTLNLKSSTASSLWSVRMVITYRHKPPGTGGTIPAEGWYYSPVFDSMQTGETAGIKSEFNTLSWTESRPAGGLTVQFRIASSDASGGPWTYYGPDGLSSSYYGSLESDFSTYCTGSSGTYGCRISPDHNNKRYLRYMIHLCNENGCAGSNGISSPKVEKVILNWSP